MECLWVKNEELRKALETQDTVIEQIIQRCKNTELKTNEMDPVNIIIEAEKAFDKKLITFMNFMTAEFKTHMDNIKCDISKQIQDFTQKTDKVHQEILDKLGTAYIKETLDTPSLLPEVNNTLMRLEREVKDLKDMVGNERIDLVTPPEDHFTKQEKSMEEIRNKLEEMKKTLTIFPNKAPTFTSEINSHPVSSPSNTRENKRESKSEVDIMMFFDSNGKYIDRKKLWKLNDSVYVRSGQLNDISKYIDETNTAKSEYVLINVGCNDLDMKDHRQVFNEMSLLIQKIRNKYKGIKLIISEITPRKDERDNEVKRFNGLLLDYANDHNDITIAFHHNLRDTNWSMFSDAKHIHANKIAKYAANIIKALKKAYEINDKNELFSSRKSPEALMNPTGYIMYHVQTV